ncbi:MAG: malonate decarboxylase subunit alpha [Firmicutes bacterium]|jgi:acetate CoA/acetoacetate CoA-transferase alpha subunit|nr:malonate decarboxylase subunit alpha [Bacillota bacterium]
MAVVQSVEEAVKNIKDGTRVMIGGFLGSGSPLKMIDTMVEKNVRDLDVISVTGCYPGGGFDLGKLSINKQIKKFTATHIGTDPQFVKQYLDGELEVEFNPMGTWIERIRAGGAGLGAVVTPVGIGTEMEEGREKINVEGRDYLVYPPLRAEVAIIKAHKADKSGNLVYKGTAMNSNVVMATAADLVIAEVEEVVEVGELYHGDIKTPGIFVDIIVVGNSPEERKEIYTEHWEKTKKL